MAPAPCPHCDNPIDIHGEVYELSSPPLELGDIGICIACGGLFVYYQNDVLMKAIKEDVDQMPDDDVLRIIQVALAYKTSFVDPTFDISIDLKTAKATLLTLVEVKG